jgi:predicted nucleic acid-binding protein
VSVPVVRFLVDTSAWARYPQSEVAARLDELSAAGVVASCGVVELQLLGAVRDAGTYATVAALRQQAFELLEMSEADMRRALEVRRLLVERGDYRVPWAALVVAAVAERHRVAVLHCDARYDVIANATGQAVEWVVADAQMV